MSKSSIIDPELALARRMASDLGPLFEAPAELPLRPRLHHNVATSQRAEKRWAPKFGSQAWRVLEFLREHGEHTRAELEEFTGIRINVICPIVVALREHALVIEFDGKEGREHKERNGGNLLRAIA